MKLRRYQSDAREATHEAFREHSAVLGVMATGLGKTVYFSYVINDFLSHGRCLVLAHREELLEQATQKIYRVTGTRPELEMANAWVNDKSIYGAPQIVVSSVQTQMSNWGDKRRMERFDPDEFSLLVLDEAHHAASPSWRAVIDYYRQNEKLKVLGVTATPKRFDRKALGQVFDAVAFDYNIKDAIGEGWLVPIRQKYITVEGLDFNQVTTSAGDFNSVELARQMEAETPLHKIAASSVEIAGSRKTLVFCCSIQQAEQITEILNRHKQGCARLVTGSTHKDVRREMIRDYHCSAFQFLVNVGVACLDSDTEILTSEGWKGCESIRPEHSVACWKDGLIHFAKPLAIEVRQRRDNENMIVLETPRRSIRVTADHRMLYRTYADGAFKVSTAGKIANKQCELPVCGIAEPFGVTLPPRSRQPVASRMRANSYHYRKQGMEPGKARALAMERINARDSLVRKTPDQLSEDECRWIGFWVGDGTRSQLQSGGVEYSVAGSDQWPKIATWFESLSNQCGFHFCKHRVKPTKANRRHLTRWSFCRGTGFGPQRREGGIYAIEPYLEKSGSHLWWGFNQEQFAAFLHGLWCADGDHGQATEQRGNRAHRIYSSNAQLLNAVQAIAVCRGYYASIHWTNNHGHQLGVLTIGKTSGHKMTKYRLQSEQEDWKDELVWCVKSETGFIVTRRRGTVTVTGNTEGFDVPDIGCVVMARPTKSAALYQQMLGRGTRPDARSIEGIESAPERCLAIKNSNKPDVLVIDFVGNAGKHRIIHVADILGGKYSDEVIDLAKKRIAASFNPDDVDEELRRAEREYIEQQRALEAEARAKLTAKARWVEKEIDPFEVFEIVPDRDYATDEGRPIEGWQREKLEKWRMPVPETFDEAQDLIDEFRARMRRGQCTYAQALHLKRRGYDPHMTFEQAKETLNKLFGKRPMVTRR